MRLPCAFAAAVPPRNKRDELRLWSASELAAPFQRPLEANELGTIEIERGTIVRGIMRDLDGTPKVKTLVSIDRDTPTNNGPRPELQRTTYTDEAGRFELPLAASGTSILRGFGCLPQRLGLMRDQKEHVVDLKIAPYYDIKFEVIDTRQDNPGAHNVRLQGEIASDDGGKAIPCTGYLFYNRHERAITIRVPRVLRNARLYIHNYQRQVVQITDEAGKSFPASAEPIEIPDLSAPPKLKLWLKTGAPLYVGVLEANGTVPNNVKVSGVAEGEFGSRNLGDFHQQGTKWVSPGLYEGERVKVVVERGNASLHRATAGPIRLDATNAIELRLSAAQINDSKENAVNADTLTARNRADESARTAEGDNTGEAAEAIAPQVGVVNVSPDKAAAYLRGKKGVTVGEAVERDRITWKPLGKLFYPDVTLKHDWVADPKDWQYIANLARVTNGFREPHNVRIVIEGNVEADTLAECFKAFRKSKNSSFELVISKAPLNQKALRVLGSYPGLTGLAAEFSTDDVTDEDWAACISGWPNAFRLFLAPTAGQKAAAAASKLGNLNTLVLRNTNLTEAELEPLRKSRNVEALLVGDKKTHVEYLLPGGFGKWQSGEADKDGVPLVPPQPLPKEIVRAWKEAGIGAEVWWMRENSAGDLDASFDPSKLAGAQPAIRLPGWKIGVVPKLPDPGTPFLLDLRFTKLTDAGLKELAALKSLRSLHIGATSVTDMGLQALAELNSLRSLNLALTKVTDAGLIELAVLKSLQSLNLSATRGVTDAGLKDLAALKSLRSLDLTGLSVSHVGLKELVRLKNLQSLNLWGTSVTDEGLKELAGMKSLQSLNLQHALVTDAGLKELAGLRSLQSLNLFDTQVTDAGVKELRKALPDCDINR